MNPGFESKVAKVLEFAERRFAEAPDWVAFFRDVCGATGIIRQTFVDPEDLYEFERGQEYARIEGLLASLRTTTTKVMTLRLPQYLHDALRAEARGHRTSLNKLCISKLAQHTDVSLVQISVTGTGPTGEEADLPEHAAAEYAGTNEYTSEPVKTLTVTDAQNELPTLVSKTEPLVLTDGSRPVAALIHINGDPGEAAAEQHVSVVPLKDVLSDSRLLASIGDDAMCVITSFDKAPAGQARDWWAALQRIGEDQQRRGFVGTAAEIDRGDQGYDERMEEIYKQTAEKKKPG